MSSPLSSSINSNDSTQLANDSDTKRRRAASNPVANTSYVNSNPLKRSGSEVVQNTAAISMLALNLDGEEAFDTEIPSGSPLDSPTTSGRTTPTSERSYEHYSLSRDLPSIEFTSSSAPSSATIHPDTERFEATDSDTTDSSPAKERHKIKETLKKSDKSAHSILGRLSRSGSKPRPTSNSIGLLGGLRKAKTHKDQRSSDPISGGLKKGNSQKKSLLSIDEGHTPPEKSKKMKKQHTNTKLPRSLTDNRTIDEPSSNEPSSSHRMIGNLKPRFQGLKLQNQNLPDWIIPFLLNDLQPFKYCAGLLDPKIQKLIELRAPIEPQLLLEHLHKILQEPYSFYVLNEYLTKQIDYFEALQENFRILQDTRDCINEIESNFEPYLKELNGLESFKEDFLKSETKTYEERIATMTRKKKIPGDETRIQMLKMRHHIFTTCLNQTASYLLSEFLVTSKGIEAWIPLAERDSLTARSELEYLKKDRSRLQKSIQGIEDEAIKHLKESTYPTYPIDDLNRPRFEAVTIQMANSCDSVHRIGQGSTHVYIFKYGNVNKFIYKTIEGSPGMPENSVKGWIDRDENTGRAGFPTGLQFRGEIASYLLGYSSAILAKLPIFSQETVGVLMPYIQHVCTFEQLHQALQEIGLNHPDAKEIRKKETELNTLADSDRPAGEIEAEKTRLSGEIKGLRNKLETYIDSDHPSDKATLIKYCLGRKISPTYLPSELALWEMESVQRSLINLYLEDLHKPNMDRNPSNYFIVKNEKGEFEIKGYDDDCCFPDTWMKPYKPVHTSINHAKNTIYSEICPSINRKMARIDFDRLNLWGLSYAGDTYEIMKARSIVLVLGHKTGKTISEISDVLFNDSGKGFSSLLHGFVARSKKEAETLRISYIKKYESMKDKTKPAEFLGVEDQFWKAMVFDKKSKQVKCDKDGYPIFDYWKVFEEKVQQRWNPKKPVVKSK